MSLMSSLYTGVSGLRTSQNALNATSHNITNAETEGYVRQQILLTDFGYHNIGRTPISTKQIGMGVDTAVLRQVRDAFLDKSYRTELGRQGFYESQFEAADEMQDMLGEVEGVQYQNELKDFWVALQELAKEPDSIVTRATLIQSAVNFIRRSETIYNQICEYQLNLNKQIVSKVDRINEIGDRIVELNQKIRFYEGSRIENANDLRDERNLLLDELSSIIDISYKEQADGTVTVRAEEMPFIMEDLVFHMDTKFISDTSEMLVPCWPSYDDENVFHFDRMPDPADDTDIGSLKGLILARGTKVAQFYDIPVAPKEEDFEDENGVLDEAAYKTAMLEFSRQTEIYNKEIHGSIIMSVQAQFDQLVHGIVTTINDIICPNKEIELADGTKIKVLDTEKAPVGMDEDKTMGTELFSRKSMSRYSDATEVTLADGTKTTVYIYNEEDPSDNYSLYTLGELKVNDDILKDRSKLPLSRNTGTGDFDITTTEELLSAWQASFAMLSPNDETPYNFQRYYVAMVGELGNRGEKYETLSKDQQAMVNSIQNKRLSVMAVSTDEELTYLIKYQHAYNAAARYINVVSEMLEHIVTNL